MARSAPSSGPQRSIIVHRTCTRIVSTIPGHLYRLSLLSLNAVRTGRTQKLSHPSIDIFSPQATGPWRQGESAWVPCKGEPMVEVPETYSSSLSPVFVQYIAALAMHPALSNAPRRLQSTSAAIAHRLNRPDQSAPCIGANGFVNRRRAMRAFGVFVEPLTLFFERHSCPTSWPKVKVNKAKRVVLAPDPSRAPCTLAADKPVSSD